MDGEGSRGPARFGAVALVAIGRQIEVRMARIAAVVVIVLVAAVAGVGGVVVIAVVASHTVFCNGHVCPGECPVLAVVKRGRCPAIFIVAECAIGGVLIGAMIRAGGGSIVIIMAAVTVVGGVVVIAVVAGGAVVGNVGMCPVQDVKIIV